MQSATVNVTRQFHHQDEVSASLQALVDWSLLVLKANGSLTFLRTLLAC